MICRIWHGWTGREGAAAYATLLRDEVVPGIARRAVDGYRGIELLRHDHADEVEFVTIMRFDSLQAVRAFAGSDYERAVVPPKARAFLRRFDERATHYEILESTDPALQGEGIRLREEIRRAWNDDPWHGSPVAEIVKNVDARTAGRRPISGAHTIWEIVLHMTAWVREVTRRVGGADADVPPEGDWPTMPVSSPAAWEESQAELASAHGDLLAALETLPDEGIAAIVPTAPNAQTASGISFYRMLHGIVQHDAYHTGQIALLKKTGPT